MFELMPFGKRREDAFGQLMKSFHDAFNDAFPDDVFAPFKGSMMSFKTDVKETEHAYLVEAELPGFRKEDIEISYADPYLTIKAVRKEDQSVEDTNQHMVRKERRYGEYVRRFYVQNIAEDQIDASLKDGVLKRNTKNLTLVRNASRFGMTSNIYALRSIRSGVIFVFS